MIELIVILTLSLKHVDASVLNFFVSSSPQVHRLTFVDHLPSVIFDFNIQGTKIVVYPVFPTSLYLHCDFQLCNSFFFTLSVLLLTSLLYTWLILPWGVFFVTKQSGETINVKFCRPGVWLVSYLSLFLPNLQLLFKNQLDDTILIFYVSAVSVFPGSTSTKFSCLRYYCVLILLDVMMCFETNSYFSSIQY